MIYGLGMFMGGVSYSVNHVLMLHGLFAHFAPHNTNTLLDINIFVYVTLHMCSFCIFPKYILTL